MPGYASSDCGGHPPMASPPKWQPGACLEHADSLRWRMRGRRRRCCRQARHPRVRPAQPSRAGAAALVRWEGAARAERAAAAACLGCAPAARAAEEMGAAAGWSPVTHRGLQPTKCLSPVPLLAAERRQCSGVLRRSQERSAAEHPAAAHWPGCHGLIGRGKAERKITADTLFASILHRSWCRLQSGSMHVRRQGGGPKLRPTLATGARQCSLAAAAGGLHLLERVLPTGRCRPPWPPHLPATGGC